MNFLYILTLIMVISSASDLEVYQNGDDNNFCPLNFISSAYHQSVTLPIGFASNNEVYQNGNDANFNPSNFTSSAYHMSVPLHIRLTVTTVLILMLMASYLLETMIRRHHFNHSDITVGYIVSMLIFHVLVIVLALIVASDQWEFGILISYGCLNGIDNGELKLPEFIYRLPSPTVLFSCLVAMAVTNPFLAYLTVFGVYKEIFSAFIPLAIVLSMATVGTMLLPTCLGQSLLSNATVSLMLFVNVKVLKTLSSALNDGKSIWQLTISVIVAVLLIFAIFIIVSLACRRSRSQFATRLSTFGLLPFALQLSLTCVIGYLTTLLYSLFTH